MTAELSTIIDFIRYGASRFAAAGLSFSHNHDNALDEATHLVLQTLHLPHDLSPAYGQARLTGEEKAALLGLFERRIKERTPAAYLTGKAWFAGLEFMSDPRALVTGFTISVMNDAANTGAEIGSNEASDVATGRIKVTGTFTGLFRDHVLSALYDAETKIGACIVMTGSSSATADFLAFILGKIAITSDAPDDGEKQISRTYAYTAEINNSGGAALAWDQTILTVQDSAA